MTAEKSERVGLDKTGTKIWSKPFSRTGYAFHNNTRDNETKLSVQTFFYGEKNSAAHKSVKLWN